MNIFICGKNNRLSQLTAERLEKEKHEIYYLSGSKAAERLDARVFQNYNFEYQNPNINRLLTAAGPDVLILMGSQDRLFPWRIQEKDSISYYTGMTALLMAAKSAGVHHVIYLSSTSIFEKNADSPTRETRPEIESPMTDVFVRTEGLCKSFASDEMKFTVVRIPCVYGFFDSMTAIDSTLLQTRQYLERGSVIYSPEQKHAVIYYADAVETIVRLVKAGPQENYRLLQLQGTVYTEQQLMEALEAGRWRKPGTAHLTQEKTLSQPADTRLAERDDETLGIYPRLSFEECISALCKSCMQFRKEREDRATGYFKLLPFIEALVCGVLAALASYFLKDTWIGEGFDPFIIYVVLFGAVYGTPYGLLTSVISIIGAFLIGWQDRGFLETIRNYTFFISFLEYIVASVIAGYMHDKFNRKNHNLEEERQYLSSELEDISFINDSNTYVKNIYEKRLVGYRNSLSQVYKLTEQLDLLESRRIIFETAKAVREMTGMEDVALYISSGSRSPYFRLAAATSETALSCGKSLKVDEKSYLAPALERRDVYSNRTISDGVPSFAVGVYDDNNMVLAVIMTWTRDIRLVNLYESDMLAVIARLISRSMYRASMYEAALRDSSYLENTNILTEDAFNKILFTYRAGARQNLMSYTILRVNTEGRDLLEIQKLVRVTDVLGFADGYIYIILAFSSADDAQFVIRRFTDKNLTAEIIPDDISETAKGIGTGKNYEQ